MRILTRLGAIALIPIACALLGGCSVLAGARDALRDKERVPPYPGLTREAAAVVEPDVKGLLQEMALADMPTCTKPATAGGRYSCTPANANYSDPAYTAKFLDRSMVIIDSNCAGYLSSLDRMGATSRFSRSQVNAVFNYVGVLMAMAGDDPEQLGYLNAAAGLFNTSADNVESLVLLSPSPSKLTPLVEQAQAEARQQLQGIRGANSDERLSSAARWVQKYASLCTPRGIRQLLDEAIESTTDTGTSPPQVLEAARRLGPGIATVLATMAPAGTDTSSWSKDLTDQQSLGGAIWMIRDPSKFTGSEVETIARRQYLEARLGSPLYKTIEAALHDDKRRPILQAMVSGANAPMYDEMVNSAQSGEQQAGASRAIALAQSEKVKAEETAAAAEAAKKDAGVARETAEAEAATAKSEMAKVEAEKAKAELAQTAAEAAQAQADRDREAAERALEAYKRTHPDP